MAVQINVAANQAALVQSIQAGVQAYNQRFANQNPINLQINARAFSQPLGRITGDVKDFEAALAASNARVIAFGASTAILGGVIKGFKSIAEVTMEVEKNLTDINRVFGLTTKELQKFSSDLFNVSKETSSSFNEAAKAALEFSRQGVKANEVLQRTTDALSLAKLAGMSVNNAIESLTATVNGFAETGITTTQVLNKLVAVEQNYAVSAGDLAEALSRTGLAAQEAGVNIDQLNALVTAAQEKTARGGAVIGNALKTIFTRLQRTDTLDQLENFNISVRDIQGNILPAVTILQNFAKSYDDLADSQKAQLSEQVAGVYQVNILKAIIKDLNSAQGAYAGSLLKGANASNEAQIAVAKLNQSLDALLSQTSTVAQQFANNVGKITFEPLAKSATQTFKGIFEGLNEILEGEGLGSDLAKGLLKGVRNVLAGPGAIGAFFVLFKLLQNSFSYLTQALPQIVGITTESQKRKNVEQAILQILQSQSVESQALQGQMGNQAAQAQLLLQIARQQTAEYQTQQALVKSLAPELVRQGVTVKGAGGGLQVTRSGGFLPNFEVSQAKRRGARGSVKAVPGVGKIGGKPFIANNKEYQIPNFAGTGETAVIPTYGGGMEKAIKMISSGKSGSILSGGFLPNFAKNNLVEERSLDKEKNQIYSISKKKQLILPNIQEFDPISDVNKDAIQNFKFKVIVRGKQSTFANEFDKIMDKGTEDEKKSYLAANSDLNNDQIFTFINSYNKSKEQEKFSPPLAKKLQVNPFKKKEKNKISFFKQYTGVKSDVLGNVYENFLLGQKDLNLQKYKEEKQNRVLDFLNKKEAKFGAVKPAEIIAKAIRYTAENSIPKLSKPYYKNNNTADIIDLANKTITVFTTEKDKPKTAAQGYIPNFADADLPKEVEDILIAGKLEDYRIQGTSKYKFPSGKELYKSQVDNIAKRARKGTAGQAGKLNYKGGFDFERKPLEAPNKKQLIGLDYERLVQASIPGLKSAHNNSVDFSLPFTLGPDSYVDFFNQNTKTFYEAKGGSWTASEVANKFQNAKTDLSNQLNLQLQKWSKVLVYDPNYANKGFIPNFAKLNRKLLRDMIKMNLLESSTDTRQAMSYNYKTGQGMMMSQYNKIYNESIKNPKPGSRIDIHRGVKGSGIRWNEFRKKASPSNSMYNEMRDMIFAQREFPEMKQGFETNFRANKDLAEMFSSHQAGVGVFDPFVSTSLDYSIAKQNFAGNLFRDVYDSKLVATKSFKLSRIFNKKSYDTLIEKYGEDQVKETILQLSKLRKGKGVAFDVNSFLRPQYDRNEMASGYDFEKEIALLNEGFLPNFGKIDPNLLRDIIKLNNQNVDPNLLEQNQKTKFSSFRRYGNVNVFRGVEGMSDRWRKLADEYGLDHIFDNTKRGINAVQSVLPLDRVREMVFSPRKAKIGAAIGLGRSIKNEQEISDLNNLQKKNFSDIGGSNLKNILKNYQEFFNQTNPTAKKYVPFVSTSYSPDVPRWFGKLVSDKQISVSRIFNKQTLDVLIEKYGEQKVRDAILALSKWGGGRGIGFDMNSILNNKPFSKEKEIALLSNGFIPNFNDPENPIWNQAPIVARSLGLTSPAAMAIVSELESILDEKPYSQSTLKQRFMIFDNPRYGLPSVPSKSDQKKLRSLIERTKEFYKYRIDFPEYEQRLGSYKKSNVKIPREFLKDLVKLNLGDKSNLKYSSISENAIYADENKKTLKLFRGVKGKGRRWEDLSSKAKASRKENQKLVFTPKESQNIRSSREAFLTQQLYASLERHQGSLSVSNPDYIPFVSTSTKESEAKKFGTIMGEKMMRRSRIIDAGTYSTLYKKYGKKETRQYLLQLSKLGGGKGIGFDINSFLGGAEADQYGEDLSRELEVALLNSGFIPNFAVEKKINRNLLRDIIDLNLLYSDDYSETKNNLGSKVRLYRGVQGRGKRWENLKNKYQASGPSGSILESYIPKEEIEKMVFEPRGYGDIQDQKNEFLNESISSSIKLHQDRPARIPFVSTSISEDVARDNFSVMQGSSPEAKGVVGSKLFKKSRIFNRTGLRRLYEKYGKQEVKEAILALSKLGGGKGVGFDVRSFSSSMKSEKEIALLNSGFVPNFAIRKGIKSSDLKYIRHLGGSTGADLVQDILTKQFLVQKRGASAAHIINEARANKLYSALGIKVPDSQLIKEGSDLFQLTEYIEGKPLSTALDENVKSQLKERFAAISLMGDWDALGLSLDNVVVDKNGVPYQIDSGGALGFRAQGAPKGERFGADVGELNTLRDRKRLAGSIFGSLSDDEIRAQIKKLQKNKSVISKFGGRYRKVLNQRMGNMSKFNIGFIPNFASGYVNDVMKLESDMSGNRAILDTTTGPFPFIRNSSQSNFNDAVKDHGGLNNALSDSIHNQKASGIYDNGFVPNFVAPIAAIGLVKKLKDLFKPGSEAYTTLAIAGPMLAGLLEQAVVGDKSRIDMTRSERSVQSFLSTGITAISTGASIGSLLPIPGGGIIGAGIGAGFAFFEAATDAALTFKEMAEKAQEFLKVSAEASQSGGEYIQNVSKLQSLIKSGADQSLIDTASKDMILSFNEIKDVKLSEIFQKIGMNVEKLNDELNKYNSEIKKRQAFESGLSSIQKSDFLSFSVMGAQPFSGGLLPAGFSQTSRQKGVKQPNAVASSLVAAVSDNEVGKKTLDNLLNQIDNTITQTGLPGFKINILPFYNQLETLIKSIEPNISADRLEEERTRLAELLFSNSSKDIIKFYKQIDLASINTAAYSKIQKQSQESFNTIMQRIQKAIAMTALESDIKFDKRDFSNKLNKNLLDFTISLTDSIEDLINNLLPEGGAKFAYGRKTLESKYQRELTRLPAQRAEFELDQERKRTNYITELQKKFDEEFKKSILKSEEAGKFYEKTIVPQLKQGNLQNLSPSGIQTDVRSQLINKLTSSLTQNVPNELSEAAKKLFDSFSKNNAENLSGFSASLQTYFQDQTYGGTTPVGSLPNLTNQAKTFFNTVKSNFDDLISYQEFFSNETNKREFANFIEIQQKEKERFDQELQNTQELFNINEKIKEKELLANKLLSSYRLATEEKLLEINTKIKNLIDDIGNSLEIYKATQESLISDYQRSIDNPKADYFLGTRERLERRIGLESKVLESRRNIEDRTLLNDIQQQALQIAVEQENTKAVQDLTVIMTDLVNNLVRQDIEKVGLTISDLQTNPYLGMTQNELEKVKEYVDPNIGESFNDPEKYQKITQAEIYARNPSLLTSVRAYRATQGAVLPQNSTGGFMTPGAAAVNNAKNNPIYNTDTFFQNLDAFNMQSKEGVTYQTQLAFLEDQQKKAHDAQNIQLEGTIQRLKNQLNTRKQVLDIQRESVDKDIEQKNTNEREYSNVFGQFKKGVADLSDQADKILNTLAYDLPGAFADNMTNALMEVAKGTATIGDAFRDMAINFGQMIMQEVMRASIRKTLGFVGESIFQEGGIVGKQRGGIIRAENGAYIPGNRTGDRNLAMLEDGEYVLNRQAVSSIGVDALNQMNYGMFPRFQSGGGFGMAAQMGVVNGENDFTGQLMQSNLPNQAINYEDYTAYAYAEDEYFKKTREKAVQAEQERIQKLYQDRVKNLQLMTSIMGAVGSMALGAGMSGIASGAAKTSAQVSKGIELGEIQGVSEVGTKAISQFKSGDLSASQLTKLIKTDPSAFSTSVFGDIGSVGLKTNMFGNITNKSLSNFLSMQGINAQVSKNITGNLLQSGLGGARSFLPRQQTGGLVGYQSGGYIPYGSRISDNVPRYMSGGMNLMSNNANQKYIMSSTPRFESGGANGSVSNTTNNSTNSTNIAINIDKSGNTVVGQSGNNYSNNEYQFSKQLANVVAKIADARISDASRSGGELSKRKV